MYDFSNVMPNSRLGRVSCYFVILLNINWELGIGPGLVIIKGRHPMLDIYNI